MKQKKFETMVSVRWNTQLWKEVKKYCNKNKLEYSDFIRKCVYKEMEGR